MTELEELFRRAKDHVSKMTPEEYMAMIEEQKRSFVRGITAKCEHGVLDFEQCPKCRRQD
ncbi:MAG TPA: hypothetical protein VF944_04475 [Candidatus Bathyarchaeia archaeon]